MKFPADSVVSIHIHNTRKRRDPLSENGAAERLPPVRIRFTLLVLPFYPRDRSRLNATRGRESPTGAGALLYDWTASALQLSENATLGRLTDPSLLLSSCESFSEKHRELNECILSTGGFVARTIVQTITPNLNPFCTPLSLISNFRQQRAQMSKL